MLPNYSEGYSATERDYQSILIPTLSFGPLKIAQKLKYGTRKKLFKGELMNCKVRTPDDPYYFYIEEGQICLYNEREVEENTAIYWRNEGDAFCTEYAGFASIGKYPALFVATKNTVLFGFSQRQIYEFAQEDPDFFYEYVRVCHMTFAQMGHRVANTSGQPPAVRFAMWLQKLCSVTTPNANGSFDIPCNMTIKQLADLLMIHVTTCTKLLAEFEQRGLISRTRTSIHVYDIDEVERFSNEKTL